MRYAFSTPNLSNLSLEWLETNGLGGWASSTVLGTNTRSYHGLLIASNPKSSERIVLLSRLDETLITSSGRFELATRKFHGAVSPEGYRYLKQFSKDPFPQFEYHAGNIRIKKTIAAIYGENTTAITYEVLEAKEQFTLELRPFVAGRNYHSHTHRNDSLNTCPTFKAGVLTISTYQDIPDFYLKVNGSNFTHAPDWYYNFEYEGERMRGLESKEDLFTPGVLTINAKSGDVIEILVSTDPPGKKSAEKLIAVEEKRRLKLSSKLPIKDEVTKPLCEVADQFIITRPDGRKTILAGYHWFTDWGRDTMISLPGLCLVTGRFDEAKEILKGFASHVSHGMIPNRFPDGNSEPEYNTVDAILWFFIAIYKYYCYTRDSRFVKKELLPILIDVIDWHFKGTRYHIHVDTDGLLFAGEDGVQLTWMDAKIGKWVVTPRIGKPIEVNALWYNALLLTAKLCEDLGVKGRSDQLFSAALLAKREINRQFWNESRGCLFDCINGESKDDSIRPNQIFALSLPYPVIEGARAESVLNLVQKTLYTPFGLRTLDPADRNYKGRYFGDSFSRDSAYHQGTVWPWLLGPYVTALVRFRPEKGISEGKSVIERCLAELETSGIGSISEVFDGDPPHHGGGCIAQAWSVGELLRAYVEDVKGSRPKDIKNNKKVESYTSSDSSKAVVELS